MVQWCPKFEQENELVKSDSKKVNIFPQLWMQSLLVCTQYFQSVKRISKVHVKRTMACLTSGWDDFISFHLYSV